jgi:hypothetical protein
LCIGILEFEEAILPLPKSTHPEFILQNIDVDFEIEEDNMKYLNTALAPKLAPVEKHI